MPDIEIEYERRLTETEARSKSNTKRIDEMEKKVDVIHELATSMAVVKAEQSEMKSDLAEIKTSVNTIAEKPAKRWDGLIEKIIFTLVGAIVGFLLLKVGIG